MHSEPKTVVLADPRGFCAGVERAVDTVEQALALFGAPVYVRKQIVHNAHVVERLAARGAVFVESEREVPRGAVCVFSAHGVSPAVRESARHRELTVVDATCPLVSKVHQQAKRETGRGRTLLLIGHVGHEETEGTRGESPDATLVVESVEDVRALPLADDHPVAYLTQTTLSVDDTAEVVAAIRDRFTDVSGPPSSTICYASQNRQNGIKAMAGRCDLVLVVGAPNSSNSVRMVDVARQAGVAAELVDDVDAPDAVDPAWLDGVTTVGVSSGASVPESLVGRLLHRLADLGYGRVEVQSTAREDVHFAVPATVRTTASPAPAPVPSTA